jgi:hypothetical protein
MSTFLDTFPKIQYDITRRSASSNFETVTNLTFRFGIIKNVINNVSSYYEYAVKESDTPEILAEKVYNNPEAYWIILYANDMYDPQYDWPMNSNVFAKYIANKYGSVNAAKTGIHHYEKVIRREESRTGIITEQRIVVNYDKLTTNTPDVPYDYYLNLPATQSVEEINMNGVTVTEIISRDAISYFDYEDQLNEKRRQIKIIKREYYTQIINEFNNMMGNQLAPYIRTLV